MAGWHYGEGGDLGLWIYASWLALFLTHYFLTHSDYKKTTYLNLST